MTETAAVAVADRVLAEQVWRNRDEGAFRTLYRRHTPALHQFVLRLLGGNQAETEDVVQEAWIRAAERLPEFRWEAGLRTWLSGIALNLCRSRFRRRDRDWTSLDAVEEPAAEPPNEIELLDLEAAITALPDGYRTVLVLHDVEGFTHEEIGARLEISANTSKSQLSRARRALRVRLTRDTEPRVES